MTTVNELAERLGNVDGVRVFTYYPKHWEHATRDRTAVTVARVRGTAGPEGRGIDIRETLRVYVDLAGDLTRDPQAVVTLGWGDERGVMGWNVDVLGLIEHDADAAFESVSEALNALPPLSIGTC
jgi:hypothetical protein